MVLHHLQDVYINCQLKIKQSSQIFQSGFVVKRNSQRRMKK